MCHGLARGAHGLVGLLRQLIGKLESCLGGHVGHGLKRVEVAARAELARWHHAHVHVLLLCSLKLLLLLLQQLNLLLKSQLLHYKQA